MKFVTGNQKVMSTLILTADLYTGSTFVVYISLVRK